MVTVYAFLFTIEAVSVSLLYKTAHILIANMCQVQ